MSLPFDLFDLFAYSRGAVESGQWWRLATGSVVHLSAAHLAANLVAGLLVACVLRHRLRAGEALTVGAIAVVGIGTGIHWLTRYDWYAGASGVLWAMTAYAAARQAWNRQTRLAERQLARLVVVALALATLLDQQRTVSMLGEPLAPQAHLLGYGLGLLMASVRRLADSGYARFPTDA